MKKLDTIMIVCSGEDYSPDKIKQYANKSDLIIACDGGFDILTKCGIEPNIIMGDMDSTAMAGAIMSAKCEVLRYPPEKDYTDSELAIQKAMTFSPKRIYLFASTGSYADHSLVNIIMAVRNPFCTIVTSNASISCKTLPFEFESFIGQRFSLFPTENVTNIKLIGAKYQYHNCDIHSWEYSLGNESIAEKVSVEFDSGSMILILFDKK